MFRSRKYTWSCSNLNFILQKRNYLQDATAYDAQNFQLVARPSVMNTTRRRKQVKHIVRLIF